MHGEDEVAADPHFLHRHFVTTLLRVTGDAIMHGPEFKEITRPLIDADAFVEDLHPDLENLQT
ncbi:hypothetical protein D3C71_1124730 [compost metagenome]